MMTLQSAIHGIGQFLELRNPKEPYSAYRARKNQEKREKEEQEERRISYLNSAYEKNRMDLQELSYAAQRSFSENYDGYLDGYIKAAGKVKGDREQKSRIERLFADGIEVDFAATRTNRAPELLVVASVNGHVIYPQKHIGAHRGYIVEMLNEGPV
jgi:hypothetical protein